MNEINNKNKFIKGTRMAKDRYDVIKLISVDLSKATLLLKCLKNTK